MLNHRLDSAGGAASCSRVIPLSTRRLCPTGGCARLVEPRCSVGMQTGKRYPLAAGPAARRDDRRIDASPRLFPRRFRSEIDTFCPPRGVRGRAARVAAQPRAGWPRPPPPPARPGARARTHGGSRPRHHDPRLASWTLPSTPPVQRRNDPPRRSAPGASHRLPGSQSGLGRDHRNRGSPRRDPAGPGCVLSRSRGPAPHDRQRPKNVAPARRTTVVAPGRIVATRAGPTTRTGPATRTGPPTRAGPSTRTDAPTHRSIRRYAGVAPAPARSLRRSPRSVGGSDWHASASGPHVDTVGPNPWKAASSPGRWLESYVAPFRADIRRRPCRVRSEL
jgi:hypothetical protein